MTETLLKKDIKSQVIHPSDDNFGIVFLIPKGSFNPIALRKAKIVYNFVCSECNRVNKVSQHVL